MSSKQFEIYSLKNVFIEFFQKLLPGLIDPKNIIRAKWEQFRDMLLDDGQSTEKLHQFVHKMPVTPLVKWIRSILNPFSRCQELLNLEKWTPKRKYSKVDDILDEMKKKQGEKTKKRDKSTKENDISPIDLNSSSGESPSNSIIKVFSKKLTSLNNL